ncbi:MAG: hypothetical protein JWR19_4356 [Pedosphaera sp.]|nr:hypothetical protein [Pedosphaera sp.]
MIAWKPFGYDWNLASARLRSLLPCRQLQQAGWPCEIFQPDRLDRYQLVVFQKAYTAEDLALATHLHQSGRKVVFDLCDNHFYQPANEAGSRERVARLNQMIDLADAVSVSTPAVAALLPHRKSVVIDDAVDDFSDAPQPGLLQRLRGQIERHAHFRTRLVWFGNAGTEDPPFGLVDLAAILPDLNRLNEAMSISLSVISNSRPAFERYFRSANFPVRYFDWDRRTFSSMFQRHDLCLLPITPNPFTLCKSNNRLLLSLLLGVPVVADLIPSYEEFRPHVLCADWVNNLRLYIRNPALARQHVAAAQACIRQQYPPERLLQQWTGLFNSLLAVSSRVLPHVHDVPFL